MATNNDARKGRTCFLLVSPLILIFAGATFNPAVAQERGAAKPTDTLRAVTEAERILEKVLEIDGAGGSYSEEFVQEIVDFYRYGVGTKDEPGNPVVTQRFCRPYVLDLFTGVLLAGGPYECKMEPDERRPRNKLDEESARLFRRALTNLMLTAFEDLSFLQRVDILYPLAGKVFTAEDELAIAALRVLATAKEARNTGEDELIQRILEKM